MRSVLEDHAVELHRRPPMLTWSELSTTPKSLPSIIKSKPPTTGPLTGVTAVSDIGGRNEKLEGLVPTPRATVTATALSLPDPLGVAHVRAVSEIHEFALQAVPPNETAGELGEKPKFFPSTVIVDRPDTATSLCG